MPCFLPRLVRKPAVPFCFHLLHRHVSRQLRVSVGLFLSNFPYLRLKAQWKLRFRYSRPPLPRAVTITVSQSHSLTFHFPPAFLLVFFSTSKVEGARIWKRRVDEFKASSALRDPPPLLFLTVNSFETTFSPRNASQIIPHIERLDVSGMSDKSALWPKFDTVVGGQINGLHLDQVGQISSLHICLFAFRGTSHCHDSIRSVQHHMVSILYLLSPTTILMPWCISDVD